MPPGRRGRTAGTARRGDRRAGSSLAACGRATLPPRKRPRETHPTPGAGGRGAGRASPRPGRRRSPRAGAQCGGPARPGMTSCARGAGAGGGSCGRRAGRGAGGARRGGSAAGGPARGPDPEQVSAAPARARGSQRAARAGNAVAPCPARRRGTERPRVGDPNPPSARIRGAGSPANKGRSAPGAPRLRGSKGSMPAQLGHLRPRPPAAGPRGSGGSSATARGPAEPRLPRASPASALRVGRVWARPGVARLLPG